MLEETWLRALTLMLLGMGVFFLNAALLALIAWISMGDWRLFITELAVIAALLSVPMTYYAWRSSIFRSL